MSATAQGNQATRSRWSVSEPLQFALGAVLLLAMVGLAVDLMSRLAGHAGDAWLYGLEGLTLPLLAVAAVVLMWQSRTERAARHGENAVHHADLKVADGGSGLAHPPANDAGRQGTAKKAVSDGGSFPVRKRH